MSDKIKDLMEKLKNKSAYELFIWNLWLVEKIDCRDCVATRKAVSNSPPECHRCVPASKLIKKYFGKKE